MGLYSNELLRIQHFVNELRRHGQEEALWAMINFCASYDFAQLSQQQCVLLTDYCLVEYDRKNGGFAIAQEVVEWSRYFADVRESGRYGAIRGLLRKYYLIDPARVRRLEALMMNVAEKPMLEVHHLQEMDLIWKCGDTHVLRPDAIGLFREYFKGMPAGRVTLHAKPKSD